MSNFTGSAVRGTDGEVDTGYLIMFVAAAASALAMVFAVLAIPAAVIGVWVAMYLRPDHVFEVGGLGATINSTLLGVAAVLAGLAAVCAAGGVFRRGDQGPAPPAQKEP